MGINYGFHFFWLGSPGIQICLESYSLSLPPNPAILNWSDNILKYHLSIQPPPILPDHVQWIYPYQKSEVQRCMTRFYSQFFDDQNQRILILGINPGRFGAGVTGIPFTDPVQLEKLTIQNTFEKKQELSSQFIYKMIDACQGPVKFYSKFYLTSALPFGLISNGKNFNYYDQQEIKNSTIPMIKDHISEMMKWGSSENIAYCLGQGKHAQILSKLNDDNNWWKKLIPLPHPRWILQYKRKQELDFINLYLDLLMKSD